MAIASESRRDLLQILREGTLVEKALRTAVRQTILEHKREGLPLALWRDDQVVWVPAEELEAQELEAQP
jgi:hypothetical protein